MEKDVKERIFMGDYRAAVSLALMDAHGREDVIERVTELLTEVAGSRFSAGVICGRRAAVSAMVDVLEGLDGPIR